MLENIFAEFLQIRHNGVEGGARGPKQDEDVRRGETGRAETRRGERRARGGTRTREKESKRAHAGAT